MIVLVVVVVVLNDRWFDLAILFILSYAFYGGVLDFTRVFPKWIPRERNKSALTNLYGCIVY
jgi:hypothetical protein